MDFIDGGCLTDVLQHFPKVRMSEAEVAYVCCQVWFSGVYAHCMARAPASYLVYRNLLSCSLYPSISYKDIKRSSTSSKLIYQLGSHLSPLLQVLQALEYIHALGRMHRDIKSDNVLLSSAGSVILGKFLFY